MATQLLGSKAPDRPVRKFGRVWSSNPAVVLWGTMVGKNVPRAPGGQGPGS